jgi:putative oxidoreductase
MPADLAATILVVARVLMGGAFFIAGVRSTRAFSILVPVMKGLGAPFPPVTLALGLALQIVCGAALALGLLPVYAAAGLILFVVVATLLFHKFWAYQGPERAEHINAFISNTALVGGFLAVIAASV